MTTIRNLPVTRAKAKGPAITFRLMLCLAALGSGFAGAQTLSSGGNHDGTILLNQTNTWAFTANAGDRIVLRGAALTSTSNFEPWLRIYNPTGVLIADSGINVGGLLVVELALTATNTGTFTATISDSGFGSFLGTGDYRLYFAQFPGAFVVPSGDEGGSLTNGGTFTAIVSDSDYGGFGGSGDYRLSSNGLSDGLKLCPPTFPGTNVALAQVGGIPGATFVLFTQTNVAAPAALWTPFYTNQFDSFGVWSETNAFNHTEPRRFFHLGLQ